jgi:hypothetical protein
MKVGFCKVLNIKHTKIYILKYSFRLYSIRNCNSSESIVTDHLLDDQDLAYGREEVFSLTREPGCEVHTASYSMGIV